MIIIHCAIGMSGDIRIHFITLYINIILYTNMSNTTQYIYELMISQKAKLFKYNMYTHTRTHACIEERIICTIYVFNYGCISRMYD